MDAIDNITIGHTERLYKPVGYTMLTNLVNIVPFCLSIEAVRIIFGAFDGSGQPLDTTRLWYIFGIMAVYMPQLMGAVVMPVLAFVSLVWIDWRMAVSMFAALPLALLVLWASTSAQKKLSGRQIQAKINAGNRLEEYLQGIRVMKAYNLLGDRFIRLRDAFAELRRACIRQEALLGPFVLLSITLVRAGLTMMVLWEKHGDEALCPFLRSTARTPLFQRCSDG